MSKVLQKTLKNIKKNNIKNIKITDLKNEDLCSSTILKCSITKKNDLISDKKKYKSILIDIFKNMPSQKMIQNTKFNIHLSDKKGSKGYNYNNELNISIQSKNANETMKEIIKMINLNKLKIDMKIKLNNENIINLTN